MRHGLFRSFILNNDPGEGPQRERPQRPRSGSLSHSLSYRGDSRTLVRSGSRRGSRSEGPLRTRAPRSPTGTAHGRGHVGGDREEPEDESRGLEEGDGASEEDPEREEEPSTTVEEVEREVVTGQYSQRLGVRDPSSGPTPSLRVLEGSGPEGAGPRKTGST